VDRFQFMEENERVIAAGGRPAQGRPLLLRITRRRSRPTRSSRRVPGDDARADRASISGKVDHLRGLKENVTMG
jgi:DNA-directed RNA polymerase subunit beta'